MNRQHQHQHLQHPEQHQQQHTVLQHACIPFLTQNLEMPFINTYQHLSSQYIDQLVEIEMKRLKANCRREEENYVEQMLLENPIIVERRTTASTKTVTSLAETTKTTTTTLPSCSSSSTAKQNDCYTTTTNSPTATTTTTTNTATSTTTTKVLNDTKHRELLSQEQRQRSESCRRSRINNKIKKAKMKYRHQFMSNKLLESAKMLECLQNMIEQMETQLINQGFNALQLLNLRNIFYKDGTTAE
ncbi:hypothetical protein DOY81_009587 [Sarcophaga bullata]|nr:hypothetical protein DOY81_009587 [Sarcophaga bullata]